MAHLLPDHAFSSVSSALTNVSDAVCKTPFVADALAALPLGSPTKFLAVAGAAAFGYYVDQKLLLSSDLSHAGMQAVALLQAKWYAHNEMLLPDLFEQSVAKWPYKPCMRFGERVLSFQEADEVANRLAHWGLQKGLQAGDTVALMMENRLEYVLVWLGLAKIGVITALLNTHLQPNGLVHCAKIADTKWMIVGEELAGKLKEVESELAHVTFCIYGDGELKSQAAAVYLPRALSIDMELKNMKTEQPPQSIRKNAKISTSSMALLIYTSGTTGLPKAARVNHFSIILRSLENHVRAAFGNGLRPDVWGSFQERFGIPTVYEFYGSTEGPMGMLNACTTKADQGHLGRRGFMVNTITGVAIVKYDVEKEDYIRSKKGFLQKCAINEPGELIVKINNKDPARGFQGYYKNATDSSKKILTNVFKKGDMYFRTGDLFKEDQQHCWHFVDRIGDTFRWKGENVATNEVAEVVTKFPGLSEVCIYGVEVPGSEGRACMAAMVFDEKALDVKEFAKFVKERLPSYAMPLFLRKLDTMAVTEYPNLVVLGQVHQAASADDLIVEELRVVIQPWPIVLLCKATNNRADQLNSSRNSFIT
ncbi:hypothetical protein PsorP6_014572 [Peronosclerospora sorghi]|uniref:Uncharacterized protein n=1 Tax=Peronosclerospora sorghi TaxID=230839 RepID=A0ACC0VQK9_9STRA|nr:hypothetical protein PsorP6_014572 [Peronosclerospora sorghi]